MFNSIHYYNSYEKPEYFCHRRIVAEWLELALGLEVPELKF